MGGDDFRFGEDVARIPSYCYLTASNLIVVGRLRFRGGLDNLPVRGVLLLFHQ